MIILKMSSLQQNIVRHGKKHESVARSQEKRKLTATFPEEAQTLDLINKDFNQLS